MVNPFICGSGTFHHHSEQEDDDDHFPRSSSTTSTPRKSRKLRKTKHHQNNKNPYAGFGRDKFSALLEELEGKRQEIYTQKGSEDISFVRFAYSNSNNNCEPIVVKVRNNRDKDRGELINPEGLRQFSTESSASQTEVHTPRIDSDDKKKKTKREKQRPFYYLLALVVLILLVLALFGRSFAIILVSVGWYLVPAINKGKESDRRRKKKRAYGTRKSEKKIADVLNGLSSPKSNANENSPRRKSW